MYIFYVKSCECVLLYRVIQLFSFIQCYSESEQLCFLLSYNISTCYSWFIYFNDFSKSVKEFTPAFFQYFTFFCYSTLVDLH